ncbi:RraA family protein [Vannielia litorea]|uniref:RraA family protein n=1 Tax=Vannielia litorea TaxID=1217970 RepID=UPI001C96803A|nr:RraA family protein [Vannielia litorea]MBY6155346.1 RraA family protein [Vannielia litorea]
MIEEPPILRIRRKFPRPTPAQLAAFEGMPTGFICDAMNGKGSMATPIAPLDLGQPAICGPALVAQNGPEEILATIAALNLIEAGDVVISSVDGWQGGSCAGDQISGMMKNAGAAGFVTDGPMRDREGVLATGLPCWCTGLNPNSPYGKGPGAVGYGAVVGGVQVESGDIIVADENGVVVVPFARIDEVAGKLAEVKAAEDALEAEVKAGKKTILDLEEMAAEGKVVFDD